MFIKENIMLAIAGLKANKMRAILTMLGIIIGIASVIGIVSVGNAMTSSVTSSMAEMGSSNIMINVKQRSTTNTFNANSSKDKKTGENTGNKDSKEGGAPGEGRMPGGAPGGAGGGPQGAGASGGSGMPGGAGGGMPGGGGMSGGAGGGIPGGGRMPGGGGPGGMMGSRGKSGSTAKDSDLISMDMINEMIETYSDKIDAVSISETKDSGKAKDGTLYANVNIIGTNPGYQQVKNVELTQGRYITDLDVEKTKKVAVVSDKLVTKIFGEGADPLGQEVKIYTSNAIYIYTIVGVYEYKSSGESSTTSDDDLSTDLYIPVTAAKTSSSNKNYQSLTIKAKEDVDVQAFTDELTSYFEKLYARNEKWVASASNMESMLESMTSMMTTIAMAISGIAAISLLVGGIGVMNIMLVSVTERTREIGTRKALGAKKMHIQMQFIVESMIICAIGGIIGIILGIVIGAVASNIMGYPAAISMTVIAISFTFSMAIGIFFGYYPAKKAASLDPIEALRYE